MSDAAMEREDAMRALRALRDAQDSILRVIFDLDDHSKLDEAMTLIGDTMDGISALYCLPVLSEQ